jgi:hypothetical protein
MSIETYSARRHYLAALTAKTGGHTFAERVAFIRARPSLKNVAVKPAVPNGSKAQAAAARQHRLRLAQAETSMSPAPRPRARLLSPEACTPMTVGGSLSDLSPTIYAADGGPAISGAAKRMNVLATKRQTQVRRARLEAAANW